MESYTIFNDFENYISENQEIIDFLEENDSLINDLISPIIKTLTYFMNLNDEEDKLNKDNTEIFEYGFKYLFENLEQIKLYLRQLNNKYEDLEKKSIFIKMIFQLEEFKVELSKREDFNNVELQQDLKKIDDALSFFEENITINQNVNDYELDNYLRFYYDLVNKYNEVVLISDAFIEYCATYGI